MHEIAMQTGNEVRPAYQLYSRRAIALATFFGSVIAGVFLIGSNLKKLDRSEEVLQAYVFGVITLGTLIVLAIKIPSLDKVPDTLFHLVQLGVIELYAYLKIGPDLKEHDEHKGIFYSNWRAIGISLLVLPLVTASIFGINYLTQSRVDFGNGQSVYYEDDAIKAEAQKLGEYLVYAGYFGNDTPADANLRKINDVITVQFFLIDDAFTNKDIIGAFIAMRWEIDKQVFPENKVCFELCDSAYKVKKTLTH